jgi:exodeoxyribonuclease-3
MKIATWNVNSVRARIERLVPWLAAEQPDVVCLQELKCTAEAFPWMEVEAAGYRAAVHGQKTWNGVAILARTEPAGVETGFDSPEPVQSRLVAATVQGVRVASVYVPNGQVVGTDKYDYKKAWLARLMEWIARARDDGGPVVVCGDFNICPDERDVHDVSVWEGTVLFNPEMRETWQRLTGLGLVDVLRRRHPEPGLYTFWDYQGLAFPKDLGLRIDFVLATPDLAERCRSIRIDRDMRKGAKPSDHVPVIAEIDL